jgi:hypothetical protein
MKIRVGVPSFAGIADKIEGDVAKAATDAMRQTTPDAKAELRDQIMRAGLGGRLANTWRGNAYPKSGRSMAPAGYIWSNPPEIIDSFVRGAQVVPLAGRKYLAIPTDNVPRALGRRGSTRRMTPEQVETAFNQDLFFKRGRNGHVLAFINAVRSKSRKGWRRGTPGRLAQGRDLKPVLMFVLVRAVRMPKLLDLAGPAQRWAAAYAAALERNLEAR